MKQQQLPINKITYSTLINKAPYDKGMELFEHMQQNLHSDKISYSQKNKIIYSILVKKASYDKGINFFRKMQKKGFPTNEITYNILINKAPYDEGIELFEEMQQKGLKINKITYNTLINRTPYDKGIELFKEMQDKGFKPNVITFNTMLEKAVESEQLLQVILDLLDQMIKLNIKPNVREYRNKKGKLIRPYTVLAVQKKLKKSQTPYKKWVAEKQKQLKDAPSDLYFAWEEFFNQTTK
ncbi:hypothetical protein QUF74_18125 [Candidatus Halobeggiatoa sp. HSG11]|nr:hypothetical protein [Candidatus Halobeggiatoa sp. HSG11]